MDRSFFRNHRFQTVPNNQRFPSGNVVAFLAWMFCVTRRLWFPKLNNNFIWWDFCLECFSFCVIRFKLHRKLRGTNFRIPPLLDHKDALRKQYTAHGQYMQFTSWAIFFLGSKLFGCVILCAGSKTIFVHVLGFQFGLHLRRRCKLADMRPDEFLFPNGNGDIFVRTNLKGMEFTSGTRISPAERLQLVWSLVIHLKIRGRILFTLQWTREH